MIVSPVYHIGLPIVTKHNMDVKVPYKNVKITFASAYIIECFIEKHNTSQHSKAIDDVVGVPLLSTARGEGI